MWHVAVRVPQALPQRAWYAIARTLIATIASQHRFCSHCWSRAAACGAWLASWPVRSTRGHSHVFVCRTTTTTCPLCYDLVRTAHQQRTNTTPFLLQGCGIAASLGCNLVLCALYLGMVPRRTHSEHSPRPPGQSTLAPWHARSAASLHDHSKTRSIAIAVLLHRPDACGAHCIVLTQLSATR